MVYTPESGRARSWAAIASQQRGIWESKSSGVVISTLYSAIVCYGVVVTFCFFVIVRQIVLLEFGYYLRKELEKIQEEREK